MIGSLDLVTDHLVTAGAPMSDALPEPVPEQPLPAHLLRVGDAERQTAVGALGEHFAAGRLDQDEYDTRVQAAYASRTRVDLHGLFGDLPEPAPFRPSLAQPHLPSGWYDGRVARERPRRSGVGMAPVFLLVIVVAIVASALLRFPIFPFVLLFWFGLGRRAWGHGPRRGPRDWR
jgi:hypothetical protein